MYRTDSIFQNLEVSKLLLRVCTGLYNLNSRILQRKFHRPYFNTSLSTCSPNMTTLACTVSQKSLMKNFIIQSMERKKIGQIQGRISRRRLVCNPTIQHVIINLYTKYDSSSLQGCGEIFDEKVLRNYGRTDGRKERQNNRQM